MKLALGKQPYRHDPKTVALADFLADDLKIPEDNYDLERGRKPFPKSAWGNDAWGLCVKGDQANATLRFERIESRRTIPLTPDDVIKAYQEECIRQFGVAPVVAGDGNDNGLYMLNNFRNWRNIGWDLKLTNKSKKPTTLKIDAYGSLRPHDHEMLKRGIFFLHGIHLGLSLPQTAAQQIRNRQAWDDVKTDAPDAQPGSWGGHAVYACKYTKDGIIVWTWGMEQLATWAFLDRYADEGWGTVDALDRKGLNKFVDVTKLEQRLHDIGATINT